MQCCTTSDSPRHDRLFLTSSSPHPADGCPLQCCRAVVRQLHRPSSVLEARRKKLAKGANPEASPRGKKKSVNVFNETVLSESVLPILEGTEFPSIYSKTSLIPRFLLNDSRATSFTHAVWQVKSLGWTMTVILPSRL